MLPRDVICFSKDWREAHTSNHHVLLELARTHRVLWVNSVATRTPSLGSGRDLGKIARKLGEAARGPVAVADNLWTYTPVVLPLPHAPWARRINRQLLRLMFRAAAARLGFGAVQLWTFLPGVGDYLDAVLAQVVVYYCVDDWALFSNLDEAATRAAERVVLRRADVVFAVNEALVQDRLPYNPHTYLAPHGVDHAAFARALDPELAPPAELHGVPGPIVGFHGTVADWVDLELVAELARRRPRWSFVLVGPVHADVSSLASLPNVTLVGPVPHARLPSFCKRFDVGLVPYLLGPRMRTVSPLKAREYLSAGLPVVSTAVPEVVRLGGCRIARSAAEAEAAIADELDDDSRARRLARSDTMRQDSWQARVADLVRRIDSVTTETA